MTSVLSFVSILYSHSFQISAPFSLPNIDLRSFELTRRKSASSEGEMKMQQHPPDSENSPVVHFCFLIHGWLGNPDELRYVETALNERFLEECDVENHNDPIIVTHSVKCNTRLTSDGIELGGDRVKEEIILVLERYCDEARNGGKFPSFITISLIGNSLGGLYARYALASLVKFIDHQSNNYQNQDKSQLPRIYLNVFCTTATPHLGTSKHTYIPIPRLAEKLIGNILSTTGRDLFRSNSLIFDMAMKSEYLSPLKMFRKRIAYANAFGTDFQVPTSTAAFLSKDSHYPHVIQRDFSIGTEKIKNMFFATLCTEPNTDLVDGTVENDEMCRMSQSLDALGWTKVFVDTRNLLPFGSYQIPFGLDGIASFTKHTSSELVKGNSELCKETIKSKDLLTIFSSMNKIHIPLGHTVLVANSKSTFVSFLNRNGRSVVDILVRDLVRDILRFKPN